MLSFFGNGLDSDKTSQTVINIFRLTVILCLVLIVRPGYAVKQQEIPVAEHGIGGGVIYDDEDVALSPISLEVVAESEPFFKPRILFFTSHTVKSGENISELAVNFGLNQDTIISINKITNSRLLQIGAVLKIPNQDGILHTVKNGDTLSSIAEKYKADEDTIKIVNELFSENIASGRDLFIPGARLDRYMLQEINGDLFIWPVSGVITSPYGSRRDPFNGNRRQFHTGIDIRGSMGTPIRAAMSGRVSQVGYDGVFGNFVVISHHSGYRTLYAHMSVIRTRTGAYVTQGERIGDIGSTGLSTGPHLHFTVYKDGVTVNPRSLMR
jgi:murein DD-endopeptidase MepM/ murein hydrolase activator NlpD